ncbi:MAG: LpqB family beta-propeller domain-containing protein, partial [Microbacterium sp.]
DGFGFLASDELQPIAGLTEGLSDNPALADATAIELSPDQDFAALQLPSGDVVRLRDDQSFDTVDARAGLIAPSVDGFGYVWSVPGAHPTALVAHAADETAVDVADAWGGASRIRAMELSRDGARIVALVDIGSGSEAWVAGVVRDKGVPLRLGPWMRLATLPGPGVSVSWLDEATVGIVVSVDGESRIIAQQVGGLASTTSLQADVVTIAGGSQLSSVRVLASDGTMYLKTGARWQKSAAGILVLATQQGAPQ